MIRLVLCDIDGTLLPFGREAISARTVAAIERLQAAGIEFGPATGREDENLLGYFYGKTSCIATGIKANGKIVDVDGKNVSKTYFDSDVIERLGEFALQDQDGLLAFYMPGRSGGSGAYGITPERAAQYAGASSVSFVGELLSELPTEGLTTVDYVNLGGPENDEATRVRLEAHFPELEFVRPAPGIFDVLPRGINKATALGAIEEALGITRDEIAFFGDSENDLAMLEALPNTFVLSNGTDDAKARARYLIGDVADDAVAQVLEVLAASGGDLVAVEELLGRA